VVKESAYIHGNSLVTIYVYHCTNYEVSASTNGNFH
jgi:hypothetical protein